MGQKQCIVTWDDGDHIFPMGWDSDCEGAICSVVSGDQPYALFESPKEARKAIRISTAFARLQREQGKPENTDFSDGLQNVKIRLLKGKS